MSDHTTTVVGGAPPVPGVFEAISLLMYAVFAHVWGCFYWVMVTYGQALSVLVAIGIIGSWVWYTYGPRCKPSQTESWKWMKESMKFVHFYWEGLKLVEWIAICCYLVRYSLCVIGCFLFSFAQAFWTPKPGDDDKGEDLDQSRPANSNRKTRDSRASIDFVLNTLDDKLEHDRAAREAVTKKRAQILAGMGKTKVSSKTSQAQCRQRTPVPVSFDVDEYDVSNFLGDGSRQSNASVPPRHPIGAQPDHLGLGRLLARQYAASDEVIQDRCKDRERTPEKSADEDEDNLESSVERVTGGRGFNFGNVPGDMKRVVIQMASKEVAAAILSGHSKVRA